MERPPGWRRLLRLRDSDLDTPIDDELRFHLDMRTEELVRRGVPETEARRRAAERFGDAQGVHRALGTIDRERHRAERRRESALDLWQDVQFAFRVFARRPLTPLIIILCLALGIGSATTVFSVGDALLLRPLPYPNGSRLVQVGTMRGTDRQLTVASFEDFSDWRDRQRTFDALGAIQRQTLTIVSDGAVRLASGAGISSTVFAALGIRPVHGRLFNATDDRPGEPVVAVVTEPFAQRILGSADTAVGGMLTLGEQRVEVVGVIDDASGYPDGIEIFLSMPRSPVPGRRTSRSMDLIGALREGVSLETAQRDLTTIAAQVARDHPGLDSTISAGIRPLRDRYVGSARPALGAIAAAAGLLLIIACANVAGLQLARGSSRAREMSVRTALGAARSRVMRLLLTESLVLAVFGGVAGIGIAVLATNVVAASLPAHFAAWMAPMVDLRVLAVTLAVSMLTGIGFGLAPALRLSQVAPARMLHDGGRGGLDPSRTTLQRVFVALQMALSVVLLVGAAMAATSFSRLTTQDRGFSSDGLTTFRLALRGDRYEAAERRIQVTETLVAQLRTVPGVEAVAAASHVPIADCCSRFGLHVEGEARESTTEHLVTGNVVTPEFFDALGITLVSGRTFTASDRTGSPPVFVINETFAREFFPGRDPLGRVIHEGSTDGTVIGVVRDVKQTTLMDPPEPQFYLPQAQKAWDALTFVVRLRDGMPAQPMMTAARRIMRSLDPLLPLYRTLAFDQVLQDAVASQRTFRTLLQGFALIALVLAAAGMYGITSYYVAQRIPELGIRLALGAKPGAMMGLVLRQGAALAAIGALAGTTAAIAAARVLSTMLYDVRASEPSAYLRSIGVLVVVAFLASLGPARRALRVEPLVALRVD